MQTFRNKLYYGVKGFLPQSVRMALRRKHANSLRSSVGHIWPIKPGSEIAPVGWPGWPQGKKFAVILTHDVEGPVGLERVRSIMELEKRMGFRSAFYLVPEGSYEAPRKLREELCANGFEVGVHDLYHNGKLYHSYKQFRLQAHKINEYLESWQATGFRSAFMHHNLDWIHHLNIRYDASTFDTDPFEPQPDGVNTIFPFWIPAPANCERSSTSSGYVELPYTMPQDSTLFLVLQEKNIDIWRTKLDWVAQHGGMVFIDTHPDYMNLDGKPKDGGEYPIEFYKDILNHIQSKYAGQYWQALPREIAEMVPKTKSERLTSKPKRIGMITHSYYESDNRVMRYAEALAQRGDEVEVMALRRNADQKADEIMNGVRVIRLQQRAQKSEQKQSSYLFPLIRFFFKSMLTLSQRHLRMRYDMVHAHNLPDFIVFAAWLPKLTGAAIILDIHDLVPEFYCNKFNARRNSLPVSTLQFIERMAARFANHVIISNHLWLDKFTSRSAPASKCSVFINHVDPRVFSSRPRTRQDDRQIILFPGGLQWHQGLDIAIRAFATITQKLPKAEFHIYGDGNQKEILVNLAKELGLNGKVKFFEPLPSRQLANVIANADLGVVPKRADSFGNEAYSTKIMEFMSMGIPVVISSTKIDRYYFDNTVVRFFESGIPEALANAIIEILTDHNARQSMTKCASDYAFHNSWDIHKKRYLELVDSITPGKH